MLVALYHFHTTSHVEHWALVRHAYLFVDFFFVLSGFVLTHAYWDCLRTRRDVGVMLWRRLGRLWPLHVALLAALVAIELAIPLLAHLTGVSRTAASAFDPASPMRLSAIPTNLLLIHALGIHDGLTWNFPSWSISVEMWTYVVFALVVALARRRTAPFAVALIAVSGAIIMLGSTRGIAVDHDLGLFRCIAGFFVGHLVHRSVHDCPSPLPGSATMMELAAVACAAIFIIYAGRTPIELGAPLLFGALVWVFAREQGHVSQLLRSRPLATLGLVSYSVYMVHSLVIVLIHRAATVIGQAVGAPIMFSAQTAGGTGHFVSFGGPWAMDALVAVYLVVVLGLAMLTWRWIEMPAQRWWNGWVAMERPSTAAKPEPTPAAGQCATLRAAA